jgi:hypothetical protein
MRKTALAAAAVMAPLAALGMTVPAYAGSSVQGSFTIHFPQGHPASNAPCDPNTFCGVGSLTHFGAATITIDEDSFGEIPGSDCFAVTRIEHIDLQSGTGTLELDSTGTFCRPGGSGGSNASDHSYGSPGKWSFTTVVNSDPAASTGVFAGMTGSGTESMVTAGGVGSWKLVLTLNPS